MKSFRSLVLLLLCVSLILSGCSSLSSVIGTLGIDVADVSSITVTTSAGKTLTTQDQQSIRSLVDAVNRLTLDSIAEDTNSRRYQLQLQSSDGTMVAELWIADKDHVIYDGTCYAVDASAVLRRAEALECDIMTDEELIRTLFESDYLSDLTILGEDGRISLDKISRLGEEFPVLFEILGRPSALESLGTYGLELLEEYLNSNDINLRQRAQQVAEFISAALPQLKEKIDGILETVGK